MSVGRVAWRLTPAAAVLLALVWLAPAAVQGDVQGHPAGVRSTGSITVSGHQGLMTTTGNGTQSLLLGTFSDSGCTNGIEFTYTVAVSWGDGATGPAAAVGPCSAGPLIIGTHSYAMTGTFTIGITVTRTDQSTAGSGSASIIVAVALNAAGINVAATRGISFTAPVATFTDVSPGMASDYQVTVDWGDSSSSAGTVMASSPGPGFTASATHIYAGSGTFIVKTLVSKGTSTASASSVAIVSDPIVTIVPATGVTAVEGASTTLVLGSLSDSACTSTTIYTVTAAWGDTSANSSGAAAGSCAAGFQISAGHIYIEEGSYAVTVQIGGSNGAHGTATVMVGVADAPLTGSGRTLTATRGVPFSGVVAHFVDADPLGAAADYAASSIAWGDGTPGVPATIVAASGGGFDVSGSHTYQSAGSLSVAVTVRDSTAQFGLTSAIAVSAPPLMVTMRGVSGTAGSPIGNAVIATFTDPACSSALGYSASVDWGDLSVATSATVSGSCANGFSVSAGHTYAQAGTYELTLSINGPGGSSGTGTGQAHIAAATVTTTAVPVQATEGTAFTGVVARFTGSGAATDYAATVSWGDGASDSAGTIAPAASGGGFVVNAGHTYVEEGSYQVLIHLTASGVPVPAIVDTAQVADAPLLLTGVAAHTRRGQLFSGVIAHVVDADPQATAGDYTVQVDWGDSSPVGGATLVGAGNGFDLTGMHTYSAAGSFTITIHVLDHTAAAQVTSLVMVAAGISIFPSNIRAEPGAFAVANFLDDDCELTTTYSAVIDWGDGTPLQPGAVGGACLGSYIVSGVHRYALMQDYSVAVTVHDSDGETASVISTITGVPYVTGFDEPFDTSMPGPSTTPVGSGPIRLPAGTERISVRAVATMSAVGSLASGSVTAVTVGSPAGTPLATVATLLTTDDPQAPLSIWRVDPDGGYQAGYFSGNRAPVDFSTTGGGDELYIIIVGQPVAPSPDLPSPAPN